MTYQEIAKRAGGGFFRTMNTWFKWGLFTLFLMFIIFNAVSISIREKSVEPALKDLGSRFLYSTVKINDISLEIIENEGIYKKTPNFFGGLWELLKEGWELFSQTYISYLWIKVLSIMVSASPFSNSSNRFINWASGLIIFLLLQSFFLLVFTPEDHIENNKLDLFIMPVKAYINLFHAFSYISQPIGEVADTITQTKMGKITPSNTSSSIIV